MNLIKVNSTSFSKKLSKKIVKKIFIFSVIMFFGSTATSIVFASEHSQSKSTTIKNLTKKYCYEDSRNSYNQRLISVSERIPSYKEWRQAIEITIPIACANNFNSWLASLAFNLNLFALDKKIPPVAVESVTPFLSIRTFGKKEYQDLAYVWQDVHAAYYPEENIRDLFYRAIQKSYRAAGVYGAAILYYQFILEGQDHSSAKKNALALFAPYRQVQDIAFVSKKAVEILHKKNPADSITKEKIWQKVKALTTNKIDILKKKIEERNELISKNNKKKRKKRKKKKEPVENNEEKQLRSLVSRWKNAPYRYGGNSIKGIGCANFVTKIIKEQTNIDLPESASLLYTLGSSVSLKKLSTGDLIFVSCSQKTTHLRVGIYLGGDEFAYVSAEEGVTISKITDASLQEKIVGARRIVSL